MSTIKLLALVALGALLGAALCATAPPEVVPDIPVIVAFLGLVFGALALGGWIGRRQERAAQRKGWPARIARGLAGFTPPALPNCASAAAEDPADARPAAVSEPPTPAAGHQRLGSTGHEFTGSTGMKLLTDQVDAHRLAFVGPHDAVAECACGELFEIVTDTDGPGARHLWATHAADMFLARFQGPTAPAQFETGHDMGMVHAAELFPQHTRHAPSHT